MRDKTQQAMGKEPAPNIYQQETRKPGNKTCQCETVSITKFGSSSKFTSTASSCIAHRVSAGTLMEAGRLFLRFVSNGPEWIIHNRVHLHSLQLPACAASARFWWDAFQPVRAVVHRGSSTPFGQKIHQLTHPTRSVWALSTGWVL